MSLLILKGCAGLGNRLITLSHAISYCKKNGRKLYVDWSDGQFGVYGTNVFYNYFELSGVENIAGKPTMDSNTTIYPKKFAKVLDKGIYDVCIVVERAPFNKIPNSLRLGDVFKKMKNYWCFIDKTLPNPNENTKVFFNKLLSENSFLLGRDLPNKMTEDIVVYADFYPPFDKKTFLENISISNELKAVIDLYTEQNNLAKKTLGIHVRSTDKKPTATLNKLIEKIKPFSSQGFQVFLATDNPEVFEVLKEKFNKVISYPKFIPQVKSEGIHQWALYNKKAEYAERILKESIIDMWLLSRCEYLFYQGNSSFSFISKELHVDTRKSFNWLD